MEVIYFSQCLGSCTLNPELYFLSLFSSSESVRKSVKASHSRVVDRAGLEDSSEKHCLMVTKKIQKSSVSFLNHMVKHLKLDCAFTVPFPIIAPVEASKAGHLNSTAQHPRAWPQKASFPERLTRVMSGNMS